MPKIDLFLEGDIGLWTLDQFPTESVGNVFSNSGAILKEARQRELTTHAEDPETMDYGLSPTMLSVHWTRIFTHSFISRYPRAYNLHPGYLPWCRGIHPAFWAMWTDVPAGATLHLINEKVDGGDIVDQIRVPYDGATTLPELNSNIVEAEKQIILRQKTQILSGELHDVHVPEEAGSFYTARDYVNLLRDIRENWRTVPGAELVKLARCTTGLPLNIEDRVFNLVVQPLARSN